MVHDGDLVLELLYLVIHELKAPLHVLDDILQARANAGRRKRVQASSSYLLLVAYSTRQARRELCEDRKSCLAS